MKKLFALLLSAVMLLPVTVGAAEELVEISTPQELAALGENPYGSYVLTADLDMTGIHWVPIPFSGTLDGNGYSILNLTVTQPGLESETTYDGNGKPYDTQFAGLFSTLKDAAVQDLHLVNTRVLISADRPCFVGGLAGYCMGSTVTDCSVEGNLELRAHDRMFGIGGLVGFGNGTAKGCKLDVTLICTDTGKDTLDEQFLGGVLANGFMDIRSCDVTLRGYASEYGYAHTGGLVGMYYQNPLAQEHYGRILYNKLMGKITFFECNEDRRAYCKADAGEIVATHFGLDHNTLDFTRDERKEYDRELRPEMCENPAYSQQVVQPTCESFGYTQFTCTGCGYAYRDAYTLKSHSFDLWQTVLQPSPQQPGKETAVCSLCAAQISRNVAYIPPETTPEATPEPTTAPAEPQPLATKPAPAEAPKSQTGLWTWLGILTALVAAALSLVLYAQMQERKRRRRRRQRRRRG